MGQDQADKVVGTGAAGKAAAEEAVAPGDQEEVEASGAAEVQGLAPEAAAEVADRLGQLVQS